MTHRILIVLGVLAALPLGGVASAQTTTATSGPKVVLLDRSGRPISTSSAATSSLTRATSLVGRPLVDTTGLSLGRISDLVITPDGQVTTLVELPGGGFTGVPLSSVSTPLDGVGASGATGTATDRFVFTGDVGLLHSAPVIQNLSALDAQFPQSIGEHFGLQTGQMTLSEQPTTPIARLSTATTPASGATSMGNVRTQRRVPLQRTTPRMRAQRRAAPRTSVVTMGGFFSTPR